MNRSDPEPVVCETVFVFVLIAVPEDVASTATAPNAMCEHAISKKPQETNPRPPRSLRVTDQQCTLFFDIVKNMY
jgi:hypothetical protein